MRKLTVGIFCLVPCLWTLGGSLASAEEPEVHMRVTHLTGFRETPPKLTAGNGTFQLTISADKTTISYTLTFANLTSTAEAAHIHFGQPGVAGAVFAFLCGGGGKPVCPANGGTVTGTIMAADILAVPAQNITAGDMAGAIRIIQSGTCYANVHTTNFPAGEIRGDIRPGF